MSEQEVKCLCCEKMFMKRLTEIARTPRHFCSRNCAAQINNQGKRRHPPRKCKKCSQEYITTKEHRSLGYCVGCKATFFTTDQAKAMTIKEYTERDSVKNKHPSWRSAHIRNFNRSWNKQLAEQPCQVCGYSTHVELAHIKAISDFPESATLGEINSPDNIYVLCPNHHWEFDNGKLPAQNIPPR